MGVHGLWDLLAPVGRRVSVETLAGKRLAIDASIWMIQFMKAMRDENGEMVRNAHLLGFFRRICKLLFLRTKPVFVFDGGTPALKRRTVIARRRHRENAQAKIRKTAEKLLLNQFKQMRLKELAEELERQRMNSVTKGKKVIAGDDVQKLNHSTSGDEKELVTDEAVMGPKMSGGNVKYYDGLGQEELDEMLAASLLTEEEGFTAGESSSGAYVRDQDEDAYEDEELILPTMNTKLDPAVIAALPPSMQLDLLVQMRERLMAENRQKYQKVKKVPSRFSELQIEAYLKTVAFRREIDEVQKTAAGRGISGVQTSRIASEANREFIFSSSFSGDKEVLTSAGRGRGSADHVSAPIANSSKPNVNNEALGKGKTAAVSTEPEPQGGHENDVETYLDERGRFRVSRVRAMGIRMTRDLQRNLDLMKEIEEERLVTSNILEMEPSVGPTAVDALGQGAEKTQPMDSSILDTGEIANGSNKDGEVLLTAGNALEISFEDNDQHESGGDDDLFASLVAGDPVIGFSVSNSSPKMQASDDALEMEWVEGNNMSDNIEVGGVSRFTNGSVTDDKELEWEEGSFDINQSDSPHLVDCKKNISKGDIEEQADFQEAIRRSLQDVRVQKSDIASCPGLQCRASTETAFQSTISEFLHKEDLTEIEGQLEVDLQGAESRFQVQERGKRLDTASKQSILLAHSFLEMQSTLPIGGSSGETEIVKEQDCQSSPRLDLSIQGTSTMGTMEAGTPIESLGTRVYQSIDQLMDTSSGKDDGIVSNLNASQNTDVIFERLTYDLDPRKSHASVGSPGKTAMVGTSSTRNAMNETDFGKESANELSSIHSSAGREEPVGGLDYLGGQEEEKQVMKARLEEEMLMLGQQQLELGNEQKRLERTAESVSNEMFAEAQELLQMFGLPYIVAPMEAEAQCAFMELTNLVDGVVTDDSDAFLFGARSVYKNIFDNRKYVETYFMKDIEHELGLNRDKLIRMALLLGSDYTEGISGIGIVNAIEVVNAFPEEDGLCKFREWIESPDPSILGKIEKQAGGETGKTQSKVGDLGMSDSNSKEGVTNRSIAESGDEIQSVKQTFMDKHRNVSKNWHIPSTFPSDAVISAYASPQVDKAREPFSWGKPDLLLLRKLCWEKFGWNSQKASELLLPVLKEYDKRETQLRLEAFYTFNERFAKIRSKRIKKAVKGIAGAKSSSLMDDSLKDSCGSKKRRRVNQSDPAVVGPQKKSKRSKLQDAQVIASDPANVDESKSKVSRGKRGLSARDGRSQNRNKGDECGGRGKGSRTKESDSSNQAGFSSNDGSSAESGQEQCFSEKQHQVRRSQRTRREVKYTMNESEDGDSDQENSRSCDETAVRDDVLGELPVIEDMNTVPSETNNLQVNKQENYAGWSSSLCTGVHGSETRELCSDGFPSDIRTSEDYLAMGGGFCLDEDEVASDSTGVTPGPNDPNCGSLSDKRVDENNITDQSQPSVCPAEMINVTVNGKRTGVVDISDAEERLKKDENENEHSDPKIVERTACIDDPIDDAPRSLRALPSLRKKRKTLA